LRFFEKVKIDIAAQNGRFSYLPIMGVRIALFKGYLKPFKGYVSTIFRKSHTYIFLIFQPFEAGRIYA
jgi:hypothetical protein